MSGPPKNMENRIHANAIWQEALLKESKLADIWDDNWGFLRNDRLNKLVKNNFSGMKPVLSVSNTDVPETKCPSQSPKKNVRQFDANAAYEGKMRYLMNSSKTPKQKYVTPQTTQQEHGWRKSLELFGVGQYGLKKNELKSLRDF